MIIPIFKNLQRSMASAAAVGRLRPALGVTVQDQLLLKDEIEDDQEDNRTQIILPNGYNASSSENEEINIDNPSTWPINSEKARSIRREFIANGFRKLYAQADESGTASLVHPPRALFYSQDEEEQNDLVLATAVQELGRQLGRQLEALDENENVSERSHGSTSSDLTEDEGWMYLPQ